MTQPSNLKIIQSTDKDDIFDGIAETGATTLNATNGTYTAPASIVVPTTLAGFQFVADRNAGKQDALIMAINSDISMQGIAAEKAAKGEDIGVVEDEMTRALKVLEPLAQQFPDRQVIGVFYDEGTPTALYEFLEQNTPIELNSIFKFGYGTNPNAGDIEGDNCFKDVVAFPFPNDAKALCHDITKVSPNRRNYSIFKLTDEAAANGQPYMTKDNKVQFDLADGLDEYKAQATAPSSTDKGAENKPSLS